MNKKVFPRILSLGLIGFNLGCWSAQNKLVEPKKPDTMAVIGSIAIDLFEYRGITMTYRADVEVIIAGVYKEKGQTVHKNYWVRTDDRGYFFLVNLPRGEYALRGFRFQTVGPSYFITAVNLLRDEKDDFLVTQSASIPEGAYFFKYPAQNRFVNLRHNYFIVDRGQTVHHKVYFQMDNLRLVTGKTLLEPDVLTYFKAKYPGSAWFR